MGFCPSVEQLRRFLAEELDARRRGGAGRPPAAMRRVPAGAGSVDGVRSAFGGPGAGRADPPSRSCCAG